MNKNDFSITPNLPNSIVLTIRSAIYEAVNMVDKTELAKSIASSYATVEDLKEKKVA